MNESYYLCINNCINKQSMPLVTQTPANILNGNNLAQINIKMFVTKNDVILEKSPIKQLHEMTG